MKYKVRVTIKYESRFPGYYQKEVRDGWFRTCPEAKEHVTAELRQNRRNMELNAAILTVGFQIMDECNSVLQTRALIRSSEDATVIKEL